MPIRPIGVTVSLLIPALCSFANTIAITGATVVDGTGAVPRKATVLVRGERIAEVGPEVQIPEGARVIDAVGQTLAPGFFDLHTHLPYSAVPGFGNADWGKILKAYLYCGVTSVADFGVSPEMFEPMRRLIRSGVVDGPRIHMAARVTTPGGHGAEGGRGEFFTVEVVAPAAARAATRRLLTYKPDAIKVFTDGWRYGAAPDMTSMSQATLNAIVKEAHAAGVEVMTHTVTLERAKIAARAGVDAIVHGIGDADVDQEAIDLLRSNRVAYVSTLAVYEDKRGPLPPMLLDTLEPLARRIVERGSRRGAAQTAGREKRWGHLTRNVAALRAGGVSLAAGTDAGVTGTMHGWSTLREVQLLAAAGLTPLEAITAATGESARAIHVESERGTIAPGMLADLILIDGEPHEDISAVGNIARLFLGGREVDRERLKRDIASGNLTPMPAKKVAPLIDDMELANGRTRLGTLRAGATDSGHDSSRILFGSISRPGGGHALSVRVRMAEKAAPYGQVWFPLTPGGVEPADLSPFRGIRFEARGEGVYRVVLQGRNVRDDRYPAARFMADAAWTQVRIAFEKFAPIPDLRQTQVIAVELARPAGEDAWIELDNLALEN